MILAQSHVFDMVETDAADIEAITTLFNSNPSFLRSHLDLDVVTSEWVIAQQAQMHGMNFVTAKMVERVSGDIVGYCEYRLGETAYLSLFVMDGLVQGKLFGTAAYELLERYLIENGSEAARIDVVHGYDGNAVSFWQKCGYAAMQDITMYWGHKALNAHVMVKLLN